MQDYERLPDERLARLAYCYFWYEKPLEDLQVNLNNIVAFNLARTSLSIDGAQIAAETIYSARADPALVPYAKGPGPLVAVRLMPGAFDRLLHIDPRNSVGFTELRPADTRLAFIRDRLRDAAMTPRDQFATLDAALLALLDTTKPDGLAGQFFDLVQARRGVISVAEVADELGCSVRSIERACAARYGRTPKRLLRSVRAASTLAAEEPVRSRPETMADFAYADLPHYANEVRRLSGLSRTEHFAYFDREEQRRVVRVWPDGSIAEGAEERAAWRNELTHRIG